MFFDLTQTLPRHRDTHYVIIAIGVQIKGVFRRRPVTNKHQAKKMNIMRVT